MLKNRFKRFTAVFCSLVMVFSLMEGLGTSPFTIKASAEEIVTAFDELKSAIAAAPDDGTNYVIEIGADIDITEPLTISPGQNISITGSSGSMYSLNRAVTEDFIGLINVGGFLTLSNVIINGNKESYSYPSSLVYVTDGTFIMESGKIINNSTIGVIAWDSGSFTMNGGEISGNNTGVTGNLVMNGGKICNNEYGVNLSSGETIIMTGGEISGNSNSGGYMQSGDFTMSGGLITGNGGARNHDSIADNNGVFAGGTFNMSGGEISNNFRGIYAERDVILGGTAKVENNGSPGSPLNTVVPDNNYITLGTGAYAPESGMNIGVTKTGNDGVFVQNGASENMTDNFFADNGGTVYFGDGSLYIAEDSGNGNGGSGGENIIAGGTDWTLDDDGLLTISSDAGMEDWIDNGHDSYYVQVINVTIDESITYIGDFAFAVCQNLSSITFYGNTPPSFGGGDVFLNVPLPQITVPLSMEEVYSLALKDVLYAALINGVSMNGGWSLNPGGELVISSDAGMTDWASYGNGAYKLSVKTISIENGVSSIADYAFQGCSQFLGISLPDSIETIGDYAFAYCNNLESIIIPDNVTVIEEGAFNECSSLESVIIGESVLFIGNDAFRNGPETTIAQMVSYVERGLEQIPPDCRNLLVSPSGSMLDDKEVPREALIGILKALRNSPFHNITFETRAETITDEVVKLCKEILNVRFSGLHVGLESVSPFILKHCINKQLQLSTVEDAIMVCKANGTRIMFNVLVGAPFLSTDECVKTAVDTVRWALTKGAFRCDLFPVHVKHSTPLAALYNEGLYSPPSLWELVDVLNELGEKALSQIGLSWYTTNGAYNTISSPTTCPICANEVIACMTGFANTHDSSFVRQMANIACECKRNRINATVATPLPDRVFIGYKSLANRFLGDGWWKDYAESVNSMIQLDWEKGGGSIAL